MPEEKCRVCDDLGTMNGCKSCGKTRQLFTSKQDVSVLSDVEQAMKEFKSDLLELYNSAIIQVNSGTTEDSALNSYLRNTDSLVDSAKHGIIQQRVILIMSPSKFGKTALIKTLRYHYASRGLNISPVKTLDEFNHEHKQYKLGKRNLDFLLNYELFLLTVMDTNSLSLKNDISQLIKLAEIYSKPVILTISKTSINDVLNDYDKLSETTYSFKVPTVVRYKGGVK